jgi:hypothetical protein
MSRTITVAELFLELMASFKAGADVARIEVAIENAARALSDFDGPLLARASDWIVRHRRDPWMPTVAEIADTCEALRDGRSDELRDPLRRTARLRREAEIMGIVGTARRATALKALPDGSGSARNSPPAGRLLPERPQAVAPDSATGGQLWPKSSTTAFGD